MAKKKAMKLGDKRRGPRRPEEPIRGVVENEERAPVGKMVSYSKKAPMKTCPRCKHESHARSRVCSNGACGYEFPQKPKSLKVVKGKGKRKVTQPEPDLGNKIEAVKAAISLVQRLGGIEKAQQVLDTISTIQKL
jgi:hypothetical protein